MKTKLIKQHECSQRINGFATRLNEIENIISDIEYLKFHCGKLLLIGKSGKLDDNTILKEIDINKIGGCVAVPKLMIELAKNKLTSLENGINDTVNELIYLQEKE